MEKIVDAPYSVQFHPSLRNTISSDFLTSLLA